MVSLSEVELDSGSGSRRSRDDVDLVGSRVEGKTEAVRPTNGLHRDVTVGVLDLVGMGRLIGQLAWLEIDHHVRGKLGRQCTEHETVLRERRWRGGSES